jgi:hypothetical protein
MRLGQLARKVGVTTDEIVRFLATTNITISEDSNTKIDDEHARWAIQKYAPQLLDLASLPVFEEKEKPELAEEEKPEPAGQVASIITAPAEPSTDVILPDIIKAPKIELSGLKVLGKIEIAEKKKKEPVENSSEAATSEAEKSLKNYRARPASKEYTDRARKNPVTLQREREEQEATKRRKERLAKEKEKKTYNYLSRVKAQAPIKKLKKREEYTELDEEPVEKLPTSWWGKFTKWLNS